MKKTMMMVVLGLAIATAALAGESTRTVDLTPVDRPAQTVQKPEPKEDAKPAKAEDKDEFAGVAMIRFFTRSVEAATESGKCNGVQASASVQIAAY